MKKIFDWIGDHVGNNQDWYLWPLVTFGLYWVSSFVVSEASGREPLADMAVNLQAINGYAILTVPIFLSLFWASLAGRFLAWTYKSYAEWIVQSWQRQLIDIIVPLTVFVVCMYHFDRHS